MSSSTIAYNNNHFQLLEAAGLPLSDLGLQRGYGIFDFLRVRSGIPLFLEGK